VDKPGAVAQLSSLLSNWGVNIAGMALGRDVPGGEALFTLSLDQKLSTDQLEQIRALEVIESAYLVEV